MSAPARTRQPRLQVFLLGLLLGACLVAQTLGLVHRTVHGSPRDSHALQVAAGTQASAAARLFAGHTHASDCLVYDHLGTADLLAGAPVLALPAFLTPLVAAVLHAGVPARVALPFQARAPPFLR